MNVTEAVTKFNWVDIFVICIILITTYRGSSRSFIIEAFKFLGIICAVFVSLQYFSAFSDFLLARVPLMGVSLSDFFSFVVLAAVMYLVIVFIREGFCRLLVVEAASLLDKWGGFIFGFLRGVIFASMLLFLFSIPATDYLRGSVKKSYMGSQLVVVNVKVYEFIMKNMFLKIYANQKPNDVIYEVIDLDQEVRNQ